MTHRILLSDEGAALVRFDNNAHALRSGRSSDAVMLLTGWIIHSLATSGARPPFVFCHRNEVVAYAAPCGGVLFGTEAREAASR